MTDAPARSPETLVQAYFNRRMLALLGLGFASGLMGPYGLLRDPLTSWLIDAGYSVKEVGLAALVGLPFTFNFVMAPFLDRFQPPAFARLGRRRGWILLIQLLLLAAAIVMALVGPDQPGSTWMVIFFTSCVVMSTLAAAHDVVNDAYRTDVLPSAELGAGAAVYVNGYRAAMLLAGAAALALATWLPWRYVIILVACLLSLGIIATLIAPRPEDEPAGPATLGEAVIEPFRAFLHQHGLLAIVVLAFVILFKLPDALAGAMIMPLLQDALGYAKTEIASIRQAWGLTMTILGAFVGGALVARLGVKNTLWVTLPLLMVSNLGFAALALIGHSLPALATVVTIENLCNGMATTAYIALLMSLCDRRYSATQYALFTSMAFFTGQLASAFSGFGVERFGYVAFFTATALTGLPALLLLVWVRPAGKHDQVQMPAAQ